MLRRLIVRESTLTGEMVAWLLEGQTALVDLEMGLPGCEGRAWDALEEVGGSFEVVKVWDRWGGPGGGTARSKRGKAKPGVPALAPAQEVSAEGASAERAEQDSEEYSGLVTFATSFATPSLPPSRTSTPLFVTPRHSRHSELCLEIRLVPLPIKLVALSLFRRTTFSTRLDSLQRPFLVSPLVPSPRPSNRRTSTSSRATSRPTRSTRRRPSLPRRSPPSSAAPTRSAPSSSAPRSSPRRPTRPRSTPSSRTSTPSTSSSSTTRPRPGCARPSRPSSPRRPAPTTTTQRTSPSSRASSASSRSSRATSRSTRARRSRSCARTGGSSGSCARGPERRSA